jgi:hypothetical protein
LGLRPKRAFYGNRRDDLDDLGVLDLLTFI